MLKAVTYQTIVAWWLAVAVYQIGSKLKKGIFNVANVVFVGIIISIVVLIVKNKKKNRLCTNCLHVKECKKTSYIKEV